MKARFYYTIVRSCLKVTEVAQKMRGKLPLGIEVGTAASLFYCDLFYIYMRYLVYVRLNYNSSFNIEYLLNSFAIGVFLF